MAPQSSQSQIDELQAALDGLRPLAQKDPQEHLPKVAGVCNNLGNLLGDEGRFEEAGGLLAESLILHMMLWLRDREAYGERLGIVLGSVGDLADNPGFTQGGRWLAQLWGVVLYNLRESCFPFCRELGSLFESLEQWELALEPYVFAEIILSKHNPEQAGMAQADANRVCDTLGPESAELRREIREKLLEFINAPSPLADA
jgi:hypothetical protein